MSYRIPDEKIIEIREASDIVDLISGYLTLKKKGKNFFGLCPFHNEKTPSFSVDPTKQMYHCFGCHKGGNVITFLIDYEKMTFIESVEFLADKAGIQLPKKNISNELSQEKESLYFANKFAANFFFNNLMSENGKDAKNYLLKRGFTESIIRSFGIGYAKIEWDGLIKAARKKFINIETLCKAGLVIKKDNNRYYDRFRGRIMIPIINLSKKVVGFGGRILIDDKKSPKYINSPETPIYQKGYLLYGLFRTRDSIREKDEALFVEGYTDLISLYKSDIKNVVATLGTSLTIKQAQLIKRYTEKVILLYDSDIAGSTASMRGADIFLNSGLNVKIAILPKGHDPDSYIIANGVEAFNKLIKNAVSVVQFKIKKLTNQDSLDRSKIIHLTLESIAKIKDSIKKSLALKELAEHFSIDEQSLMHQLRSIKSFNNTNENLNDNKVDAKKISRKIEKNRYDIAEEDLVKLMILHANFIKPVFENVDIKEFNSSYIRELAKLIFDQYLKGVKVNSLTVAHAIVNPELSAILSELLATEYPPEIDINKLLNDCIVSMKKKIISEQIHNISTQIKDKNAHSNDISKLNKKFLELKNEYIKINSKKFINSENNT